MTDAGTPDPRPRPAYGEYATPEEQRARIRQPDISAALDEGRVVAPDPSSVAPPIERPAAGAGGAGPRGRAVDRIVTFALLAYGLVSVVAAIPALVDYAGYIDTVFGMLDVDAQLSDPAAGRPWGIAAALVTAVGWALTAAVSWWSIRRGRVSWWIPIAGALVFTFAASVLMLVPLMSDPAAWDAILDSVR